MQQQERQRETEAALRDARSETAAVKAHLATASDAREALRCELAGKERALHASDGEVASLRAQHADDARAMRELEDRCTSVRSLAHCADSTVLKHLCLACSRRDPSLLYSPLPQAMPVLFLKCKYRKISCHCRPSSSSGAQRKGQAGCATSCRPRRNPTAAEVWRRPRIWKQQGGCAPSATTLPLSSALARTRCRLQHPRAIARGPGYAQMRVRIMPHFDASRASMRQPAIWQTIAGGDHQSERTTFLKFSYLLLKAARDAGHVA